jgi:hypothetical protein
MERHHHHHKFPRPIARFLQLEGGQYGTVDMTALTPHKLEVQLGVDFVQFSRKQAEDLRDAVQAFLDLGRPREDSDRPPPPSDRRSDRRGEEVEEEIEEEVIVKERVVVEEEPRRRRPRRPA